MNFTKIGRSAQGGLPKIERRCLSCDKLLDEKEIPNHLYIHRFCSQACREKYHA